MRRPVLATLATSVALFAGAGTAALLPVVSDGCPGAVASLRAPAVTSKTTAPPVQDQAQIDTDQAAVDAARAVVGDLAAKNNVAQAALDDASDGGYSYLGGSWDVEYAQSRVDSAESTLESDKRSRDDYKNDEYLSSLYDYYVDRVADDQKALNKAKQELGEAKQAAANIASVSAAADQSAAELARAQAVLDDAVRIQENHQNAFDTEYEAWKAGEQQATDVANDAEEARVECAEEGKRRLVIAGVIAVVGGALGSYSFVQRR